MKIARIVQRNVDQRSGIQGGARIVAPDGRREAAQFVVGAAEGDVQRSSFVWHDRALANLEPSTICIPPTVDLMTVFCSVSRNAEVSGGSAWPGTGYARPRGVPASF